MDISKTKLEGESKELLDLTTERVASIQAELDEQTKAYQEKVKELDKIKDMIRPLKMMISDVAQMQASIASRKSRAKYFPEFATKNYRADAEKDKAFEDMVRKAIK